MKTNVEKYQKTTLKSPQVSLKYLKIRLFGLTLNPDSNRGDRKVANIGVTYVYFVND